jgi:hypothetical protein
MELSKFDEKEVKKARRDRAYKFIVALDDALASTAATATNKVKQKELNDANSLGIIYAFSIPQSPS